MRACGERLFIILDKPVYQEKKGQTGAALSNFLGCFFVSGRIPVLPNRAKMGGEEFFCSFFWERIFGRGGGCDGTKARKQKPKYSTCYGVTVTLRREGTEQRHGNLNSLSDLSSLINSTEPGTKTGTFLGWVVSKFSSACFVFIGFFVAGKIQAQQK